MTIAVTPDGQFVALRRGTEVVLLAEGVGPPVGMLDLEPDSDLAAVGPPSALVAVLRGAEPRVMLYQPPYLDAAARHDLDAPMRLVAVTGPRVILTSLDAKQVLIVRAAGRGLSTAALDPSSTVEFAVGLERNQILLGLLRKLEVWDAVSGRPLLRLQLQLPPPPRTVGAAQGHLWVTRPGSDEVLVFRLSDGRPFRHHVGAPVLDVVCHPTSPLIVLVTARGLVRLHCFAHSLHVVDSPWTQGMPLAQVVAGDDIALLGLADGASEPWRVALAGTGAPLVASETEEPGEPAQAPLANAAEKLRAMRARSGEPTPSAPIRDASEPAPAPPRAAPIYDDAPARTRDKAWRQPLAAYALELTRGLDSETPIVAVDTELGDLAHRLQLSAGARRALIALYGLHLVGDPAISIARLGQALGDWTEGLGQGDLAALGMLRRKNGKVSLRASVTDLLDHVPPRTIRVVGGGTSSPHKGVARVARDGKPIAALELELATRLGRIAVLQASAAQGLLEARLRNATAVAFTAPSARPSPWPRDASLVVVVEGEPPAWVGDLPEL
jgi:hypothetical protein